MSYAADYASHRIAAEASADARAIFIRRTYGHLAGAILLFTLIETALVNTVPEELIQRMFSGRFAWLICLGAFMGVSYIADMWARSSTSKGLQYIGLGLYVVAESVIFLPLLYIAAKFAPDVIPKAGILTLTIFGGLTVAVLLTRNDFSYLRTFLSVGSFVALGVILVSMFMGTGLGLWFSFAMVGLACGFILYETSNVLRYYRTDQYVAAALTLFASVALLFWYILLIFLQSNRRGN
jgi:FtsH-binding integral membrane protein